MRLRKTIQILERYLNGKAGPEEEARVEKWYEAVEEPAISTEKVNEVKEVLYQRIRLKLSGPASVIPIYRRKVIRIAAAAVFVFAVAGVWFMANRKSDTQSPKAEVAKTQDIAPGHEGAVLTLADGSQIVLDSTQNGVIAQQGNSNVVRQDNGLSYQANSNAQNVVYNTMSTPNGRQYALVLADGSKAWLNAGSSIRFPSAFIGKERRVEVTGEVYFEITHDASKPFIVTKGDVSVQVLGTRFNVNAYDDEEAIRVTLLQGSVKVGNKEGSILINPGEQAVATTNHKLQTTNSIDLDEVMAWKNGKFSFNKDDIKTVMRQLARWYDIEVVYQGEVTTDKFWGDIKRDLPLSKTLDFLRKSDVRFDVEGKKVIVKK